MVFELILISLLWQNTAEEPLVITVRSMNTTLIQQAEIAAGESGVLREIHGVPGANVTQGTLLASLDLELQEIGVKQAEVNLKIAELKASSSLPVETARAAVREAEQEKTRLEIVADVSARVAGSDVGLRLAEKNQEAAMFELNRAQKARDAFAGSISNAEINRLQVLYETRRLELEKATEDQLIARLKPAADQAAIAQQIEVIQRGQLLTAEREQEMKISAQSLELARQELDLASLRLERRRLKAPFSGTIVSVRRQPGEWVEAGTVIIKLVQLDRLRVEGFLAAAHAPRVDVGQTVKISFNDMSAEPVKGVVTFISPEVEPVNQQVRIWAEFDNPSGLIRPGLIASMEIHGAGNPVTEN